MSLMGRTAISTDFWFLAADGALYAALLLLFLGTHEFGHYFAARFHKVDTTLPYFIPVPFIFIGTLGAVIRIRSFISHSKALFDIGIAGPVAGFLTSLIILFIGFLTVPAPDFMAGFTGHEALNTYIAEKGTFPEQHLPETDGAEALVLGETLLFSFLASFADNVPPNSELYHYPWLFAGWLGLFFTGLNLMPIGQLDGGHVIYAMFGPKVHRLVARSFLVLISGLAGAGFIPLVMEELTALNAGNAATAWLFWSVLCGLLFYRAFSGEHRIIAPSLLISFAISFLILTGIDEPGKADGMLMWLFWMMMAVFVIKVEHPPVFVWQPLSGNRRLLGWLSILIFFLCISPYPIYLLS